MKVVLISSASIGPLYISTLLKHEGHSVRRLYQGYKKYLGEPAAPFAPPLTEAELIEFKPDIVGFSVETSTFQAGVKMAEEIKKVLPGVHIIFGGAHPTDCPEETIMKDQVDSICIGEGEFPMLELCNLLESGQPPFQVQNLWVKHDGNIYRNPQRPYMQDLDSIPLDRDGIFYGGLFTGRGCVGRCAFCNTPSFRKHGPGGKFFRKRSIEGALKEVEEVYKSIFAKSILLDQRIIYKKPFSILYDMLLKICKIPGFDNLLGRLIGWSRWIDPVRFKDDTFLADKRWFLEFAPRLHDRFPYLKYICQARANEIDEDVAFWLKKSGCVMVSIGFETGSEFIRNKVIHKNVTNDQISNACSLLRGNGIKIMGQWMYGLPGESFKDMLSSFVMSVKEKDYSQLHFTSPLPNTELFDVALQKGLIKKEYLSKGLYDSELIFHNDEECLQLLLVSLIHVLKDVKVPSNYSYVRYLGSQNDWRGKTVGEIIATELETMMNKNSDQYGSGAKNQ